MLLNKMKVCVCVYVCGGVIRQKYCMQVVCICFLLTVAMVGNRSQFACVLCVKDGLSPAITAAPHTTSQDAFCIVFSLKLYNHIIFCTHYIQKLTQRL